MRVLLTANVAFGLAVPVMNSFVGAYLLRKSHDVALVVNYYLAFCIGIPPGIALAGFLLRRVAITRLCGAGMLLSGVTAATLISLDRVSPTQVFLFGLFMGLATGIYWANRNFLALTVTHDINRNFYYGLESFFSTLAAVVVPLGAGWFIEAVAATSNGAQADRAYVALAVFVLIAAIVGAIIIGRGSFSNPPIARFVYFRHCFIWRQMLGFAMLRGTVQVFVTNAPAMLVMQVAGLREGALGTALSVGGIVTAVLLYVVGRLATPEHRTHVWSAAVFMLVLGGLLNAALFQPWGVWLLLLCLVVANPLLDMSYNPILMQTIETVARIENRNPFTYLLSQECGLLVGRLIGCVAFLLTIHYFSREAALRYALLFVALFQAISIPLVARMTAGNAKESLGST